MEIAPYLWTEKVISSRYEAIILKIFYVHVHFGIVALLLKNNLEIECKLNAKILILAPKSSSSLWDLRYGQKEAVHDHVIFMLFANCHIEPFTR